MRRDQGRQTLREVERRSSNKSQVEQSWNDRKKRKKNNTSNGWIQKEQERITNGGKASNLKTERGGDHLQLTTAVRGHK